LRLDFQGFLGVDGHFADPNFRPALRTNVSPAHKRKRKEVSNMATTKQRQAARRNIKKAQSKWRSTSSRQRARSQPRGSRRRRPGTTGRGEYYHVEVRPKTEFDAFRTQDVGQRGGIQRVAGRRGSVSWSDQKWLISKRMAHIENDHLIPDNPDAEQVLERLGSEPRHIRGDRFAAKPRPNVPEREKPTTRQSRARRQNIKKAQATRRKTR
jgi:hypothetical protein